MTFRSLYAATLGLAALIFCFPHFIYAQTAQIVDSRPIGVAPSASTNASQQQTAELFYQLQLMQEEVQALRGLLEEQAFELKKLKQQRLDDYVDLDRRLGALAKGSASMGGSGIGSKRPAIKSSVVDTPSKAGQPLDELATYRNAVDLLLKLKDFDAGADALHNYLKNFPSGLYTANAQYWLGETYLAKESLDDAKLWFVTLLEESPDHSKALDAKYKLGQVLHKQGDLQGAKVLLQEASLGESTTAKLAVNYLNRHFK